MTSRTDPQARLCVVCGQTALKVFWEADNLPVRCNVLCKTREEALAAPKGDITLAVCFTCGFVTNLAFDPARMSYDQRYENSLHHSRRFQSYATALAKRLVDMYDLHNKDILEIACGQGDFLRLLCDLGSNRGLGFDPSYRPVESDGSHHDGARFVRDCYGEKHGDVPADLVCCRHALEHIPDPVAFLSTVRKSLGDDSDAVVFFEVPDVMYTLRDLGIWDIIYEHCCYFSEVSLARCFARAGFSVHAVSSEYGGQFLTIESRRAEGREDGTTRGDLAGLLKATETFAFRFREKFDLWAGRLSDAKQQGRRLALWGSGSKGVTFLNMMPDVSAVACVVDINPRKQGMFVAGVGKPIVAPEALREVAPDTVIVMNALYLDEIGGTLAELGVDVKLDVA